MAADYSYWCPWHIPNNILGLTDDPEWADFEYGEEETPDEGDADRDRHG